MGCRALFRRLSSIFEPVFLILYAYVLNSPCHFVFISLIKSCDVSCLFPVIDACTTATISLFNSEKTGILLPLSP